MLPLPLISGGLLLCGALYTDLLSGIIPNRLTLGFAVTGAVLNIGLLGFGTGIKTSLAGLATGAGLFLLPYLLKKAGGGDLKLFGALGITLGSGAVLGIFLYSALFAGGYALLHLFRTWHMNTAPGMAVLPDADTWTRLPYSGPAVLGFITFGIFGGCL